MSFNALGLPKTFLEILENENYKNPYPIQEQAIPVILKGHDVLGIAQTGSGKTASYVLPVLAALKQKQGAKDRQVDVLVLVPTRELAEQVKDVFHLFEKGVSHPVKTMAIYGGVSINPQMKSLFGISVLVATPGRLLDLVDSNAVHFDKLKTLILDEADKLLNLGFKDEMNRIFALLLIARVMAYMDPFDKDVVLNSGYQLSNSLISIGQGGWFGLGLGNSFQKDFFLPEAHTDFIFAILVEELGVVGGLFLLGLFVVLFIGILRVSLDSFSKERLFQGYVTYGILILIAAQSLFNIAVNIGLLPTKGLTLPFISYGGTSIIIMMSLIGIVLRINNENKLI